MLLRTLLPFLWLTSPGEPAVQWHAEPVARIDMTPFLNLAIHRPYVRRNENERVLDWPDATLYSPPSPE